MARTGRSILDLTLQSSKSVERKLGPRDREKLDQYLTAVRDAEIRLHKAEEWENRPKPKPPGPPPTDIENLADLVGRMRLLYDMMHLALASDSTRIITLCQPQFNGRHRSKVSPKAITTCRTMGKSRARWPSSH